MRVHSLWLAAAVVALCSGCSTHSYFPPSGRADFSAFSSPSMKESFAATPQAVFPASIAVARVQAPAYRDYRTEREGGVYGRGRYSVVTTKELDEAAALERIEKLPEVGGAVTISTLLLPQKLESDRELREAAARLKADMLLLYTIETSFHENDASVALNVITLGLSPTRKVYVHVSASALLMDTRTGFIYAALEAEEKRALQSNAWESGEAADRARRAAEQTAFQSLIGELEKDWPRILTRARQGG